ncbi:MAG: hypothetical protein RBR69_08815 [Candidatus Cloacimonadaceae bacterium]|jgi:hypothetical protein|nr:hypothetical protein [Candidatus Cloacimonadota bacterium]MCB5254291.1 hypothetical protein [Candidatus Cloacimonadota bacterium]MCK9178547.1 hypothetical protein [Candidatus Cloacimonadota bacterium]MCK9242755.1 hypothetical protein [Candidatus Cloacimonadota bacterium]MDY0128214.1 hypothetical protein [Candidatus Cloacimonadaceae bacterium]
MKRALLLIVLMSVPLLAFCFSSSASATALSGLSIISDSVADYAISPVMQVSGLCFSYHRPFAAAGINVFSVHNAISRGDLHLALGNTYLHHQDYASHNPYLNLNYCYEGLSFGATGHLLYDAIQDSDAEYCFSYDLGLRYEYKHLAAELKMLSIDQDEQEGSLSVMGFLSPDIRAALGYFHSMNYQDKIRVGIDTKLNQYLSLYGSWQSEDSRFGAGFKVSVDSWSLLYAIRTHPKLDASHAIALEVFW